MNLRLTIVSKTVLHGGFFFPNYREERVAADNNHFNWVVYWQEGVS